jgi:glycosyltransferase involved in cell wall biosynthesis
MSSPRRLHWFSPHATPYHDYVFRRLASEFPGFNVVYGAAQQASHPWKADLGRGFPSRRSAPFLGIDWKSVRLPITDSGAFFMVVGWETKTSWLLLSLLRLLGRDYALWTDTPDMNRRGAAWRERARAVFLRWVFGGARAVMGTGRPGVEGLRRMGVPEEKLVVFPFFLDLESFRRASWDRTDGDAIHFVSSGRVLNSLKGHDIAVRALVKASRDTGRPFRYSVAGTGPDLEAVRMLAAELGVSESVRLLGWTEPDDLRNLMRSADALIHPSPTPDPFPNAVLEGMAAGMVVFGSDASGSAIDRIDPGQNGFIRRAGDADHLSSQLAVLLRDPGIAARMGPMAAARAAEWPLERGIDEIRRLFQPT